MADQSDSRPSARQREQNAQLLIDVLRRDVHRLRRQASRHAELPDDADDALLSAYALFLERVIYVARQLGHGAELTMRVYGHVIEELEDRPQLPAEDAIRELEKPSRGMRRL